MTANPELTTQERLDALYQAKAEVYYKPTPEEAQSGEWPTLSHLVALDLLSRLDAAEARVKALTAERDDMKALLTEWEEPGGCGCDTFSCKGTCLVGRTRAALKLGGE